MTCTYDLSTDVGKVRLAIGDTDCTAAQLTDAEIEALLALSESWQEAALRAVDALIARWSSSSTDVRMGPRAESRSQRIEHLRALKAHLVDTFGLVEMVLSPLGSEDLTFAWVAEDETDEDEYNWSVT